MEFNKLNSDHQKKYLISNNPANAMLKKINLYVLSIYLFIHTNTHTHTHIYIYIYIYEIVHNYIIRYLIQGLGVHFYQFGMAAVNSYQVRINLDVLSLVRYN